MVGLSLLSIVAIVDEHAFGCTLPTHTTTVDQIRGSNLVRSVTFQDYTDSFGQLVATAHLDSSTWSSSSSDHTSQLFLTARLHDGLTEHVLQTVDSHVSAPDTAVLFKFHRRTIASRGGAGLFVTVSRFRNRFVQAMPGLRWTSILQYRVCYG